MKIVGITGTSGSGKSIICNILKTKYGIDIIDCDKIAKKMLTEGNKYFKKIVEVFGIEILQKDGQINRKKLANIIYTNKEECEKLNQITDNYVVPEILKTVELYRNKNKWIVIDAPLLIESKLNEICNVVISVLAKKEIKLERICKRDNIEKDIAVSRLKIQKTDEFYIQNSDYIINNNDNKIESLEKEIEKILRVVL